MSNVRCDHCGRGTALNTNVRKYKQGRQEVYFICQHCDTHYTCYVTDARVRKWQAEIRTIKDPVRRFDLQAKMHKRMDRLKRSLSARG